MNKEELLTLIEGQKNEEEAVEKLLIKKRELLKKRCDKLIEEIKETLEPMFPDEIIKVMKQANISYKKPIEYLYNVYLYFYYSNGNPMIKYYNNRTFEFAKFTDKWHCHDLSMMSREIDRHNESSLEYDSGVMDNYEEFIELIKENIGDFYQILANTNQQRINTRNQRLANTNTGKEEIKKTKTYTVSITVEEDE